MRKPDVRSLLGYFAIVVWVLAALPTIATLHPPSGQESPERIAAFERRFEHEILPTYRTLGVSGTFESQGFAPTGATPGRKIHYRVFRRTHFSSSLPERGAVVIAPDRGELEFQYAETIHDLTSVGYSVYILDHRGNGFSERLLSDRTALHVDRFLDYSADFRKFVDEVVKPEAHRDLYLLCHSMGCAVAAPFLASNPRLFRAVAMSAPMFELKVSLSERLNAWLGKRIPYDYDGAFDHNLRTGSFMRFHKEREMLLDTEQAAARIARRRYPIALGSATFHWISETQKSLHDLEATELWRSPTLMFQAANDAFVGEGGQARICERLSDRCNLIRIGDAFHDLLQERDAVRSEVLGRITGFFDSHSSLLAKKSVQGLDS